MNASSSVGEYGIGVSSGGDDPGVVEVVERGLGHGAHHAGRPAAGARALLDRQQAVGLLNRLEHGSQVERPQRAQVDQPRQSSPSSAS